MTEIFQKLIDSLKPKQKSGEIPTVPITDEQLKANKLAVTEATSVDVPQFVVGSAQSVGIKRDHNEDSIFVLTSYLSGDNTYIPLGLYIVADGMGGHKHGEIASGLAVRFLVDQLMRKVFEAKLGPNSAPPQESIQEIMQKSIQDAHQAIIKEAPGSGTTLTSILIMDEQMTIAHVGDTRAYALANDGNLNVLTRDHSLVMRMIELGQLTEDEAAIHPQRNVLYRALGQGEPFVPDITTAPLPDSGHLLICSDGLWGVIPAEKIIDIITSSSNPQDACRLLITAANNAGGPDNISAVLVSLPD